MARRGDGDMMVYVSGALKGSRDLARARTLYEWAARVVAAAGYQAYLPHQHTDPEHAATMSPAQVFQRDLAALKSASGVVAFLGEPSLGVGAELALCAEAGIPLLGLHMPGDDVSRFAMGLLEASGGRVICYGNADELETGIRSFLSSLRAQRSPRGAAQSETFAPPLTRLRLPA
jgi:hypothetical protein